MKDSRLIVLTGCTRGLGRELVVAVEQPQQVHPGQVGPGPGHQHPLDLAAGQIVGMDPNGM